MKKLSSIFLVLILLSVALLIWQDSGPVKFFRSVLNEIARPFEKTIFTSQRFIGFWVSAFFNIKTLKEENIVLEAKIVELEALFIKLKEAEEENRFLRIQLNLPEEKPFGVVGANIISSDNQNNLRSFVIDKGSSHGLKENMPVISSEKVLLGQIISVSPNTSQIQTLFDIQSRVSAQTEKGVPGVLRGLGSDVVFDFVSGENTVAEGNIVVSSGKDSIFPKNLLIGKVKSVKPNSNQVFQNARLEILTNLASIDRVLIILK